MPEGLRGLAPQSFRNRVLGSSGGPELNRRRYEAGGFECHCDAVAAEVLPVPAMDAGARREERSGRRILLTHLVAFGVALWRADRLAMEIELHHAGGLPGVDEAAALLHPVLVFEAFARPEL